MPNIPEDGILHIHRRENLKSIFGILFTLIFDIKDCDKIFFRNIG
jgi:hypothetical protein